MEESVSENILICCRFDQSQWEQAESIYPLKDQNII